MIGDGEGVGVTAYINVSQLIERTLHFAGITDRCTVLIHSAAGACTGLCCSGRRRSRSGRFAGGSGRSGFGLFGVFGVFRVFGVGGRGSGGRFVFGWAVNQLITRPAPAHATAQHSTAQHSTR